MKYCVMSEVLAVSLLLPSMQAMGEALPGWLTE